MTVDMEKAATEKERTSGLIKFILTELKPKGKWLTPFNLISIPVIVLAAVLLSIRFARGLGSITNLSQDFPWGLWIGFDVMTGVAFAGGAYVLTFMVYILRVEKYHSLIRVTVLNGFLAYAFYAGALLLDLGRPWNVINPIIGNSFGVSSVLFLVAWHFLLYMTAELIEFSPAIAEWLGLRRVRKILSGMTLGAVVFGITLSTLHQSGLGALYLMAKPKIHPLWYSEFIPILFFVSSIFAGLSMVIVEGTISGRVFKDHAENRSSEQSIVLGLAGICAGSMIIYLFLQGLTFIHGGHSAYLASPMGYWYLVELIGFVLIPCILFLRAVQIKNMTLTRVAAVMTLIGVVLNRLNISVIAFKWYAPVRYFPSWMEVEVTLAVIFAEIWVFRWVISRMPVLESSPEWAVAQEAQDRVAQHAGRIPGKAVSWKPQIM
jgi:Ni/Fe-hydrogenase subunit HybB-like protein